MKKYYSILLILFVSINSIMAQYYGGEEYSPTIVDTRSFSMGNTQILSAIGSNALFSNPAILSTLDRIQAQAGGGAYWGSYSSIYVEGVDVGYSFYPKFTNISFAIPIRFANNNIRLAISGGYHTFLDWSWEEFQDYGDSEYRSKISGGINMVSLGLSLNFAQDYNIGISYSTSLSVKSENNHDYTNTRTNPSSNESNYEYKNVSFLTFGMYANPIEKLNIGLFLRTRFDIDGDFYNDSSSDRYNESGSLDTHIEIPVYWGIGLGFKLTKSLLVNAEYQNRPYGDIKTSFYEFSNLIDNGQCIRIGAETYADKFPIRFGIYLDNLLEQKKGGEKKPVTMLGLTAGTGYMFTENFGADIGFQYNHYSYFRMYHTEKENVNLMRISAGVNYFFN